MKNIQLKRVYERASKGDGTRVLVDRLWPRGVSRTEAHLDAWLKDISPSHELRKWYGHDVRKWEEFVRRYFLELDDNKEAVTRLLEYSKKGAVTLVYAAKDTEHSNAAALKLYLGK